MSGKITVTLSQDKNGSDAAMAETIGLLTELGIVPTKKIVIALECEQEDLDAYEEDIERVLGNRPVGIKAEIDKHDKHEIERNRSRKLATVTPMDKAWRSN